MTAIERATQLSDATFLNIETAFYYLFATPIGWTFWGVLASLIVYGLLADHEKMAAEKQRRIRGEQLRAQARAEQEWGTLGPPTGPLAEKYRSPAGYNRGIKKDH